MLHVEQIKWFGTKNITSEYYSGIIKEEDWWYELCNLCCHHRMGWLLLSWWNRGRQIPIFKASRKVDVLVATKMNISSIGVHSLMRVWNGWEKANMNTCHFGGEQKANYSTDNDRDGGTSYQDNSIGKMHKVQERRCATPYSFENRDCYLMLLTLTPERLQKPKVRRAKRRRCWRRSLPLKTEKPSSCVGRKTKAYRKGWLGRLLLHLS